MAAKKEDAETAKSQRAAEASAEQSEDAARTLRDETEKTARTAASAGRQTAESMQSSAQQAGRRQTERMQSATQHSADMMRGVADYSKGDVDAFMQTSSRLARGMQDVSMEVMQMAQQNWQFGMQAAGSFMDCRSVEDMMNVQRDLVRRSVDQFINESARILQISSRVANEAVEPLSHRMGDMGRFERMAEESGQVVTSLTPGQKRD